MAPCFLPLAVFALAALTVSNVVALVPNWSPTYNMSLSTIFMPCNNSGWFNPGVWCVLCDGLTSRNSTHVCRIPITAFSAQFGVADFDWSNAKQMWANQVGENDE